MRHDSLVYAGLSVLCAFRSARLWPVSFALLVVTGCQPDFRSVSTPGADPDPGQVADPPILADADAGAVPAPAPGPSFTPPADLTPCEVEQVLAFVNDPYTTASTLHGVGLDDTLAAAVVDGRGWADGEALAAEPAMTGDAWRVLVGAAADGCALPGGEPAFEVRFTEPQCDAVPAHGVPAGVRCYGSRAEQDDSRQAAGIVDHIVRWIDATRRARETHPGRDVRIAMAYPIWSEWRIYEALCRATAAGVRLDGYFDRGTESDEPARLAADPTCGPERIHLHALGGVTDYPDWRLMQLKMMLFDTGEPTTRLLFGSANMTTYGTSIHFENWVFGRFPSDSWFVDAHRCASTALEADAYREDGTYPNVFRATYDRCVGRIPGHRDPRFRVFFGPDPDMAAMDLLEGEVMEAAVTVDVAAQHFSAFELGRAIRDAARAPGIRTRLLLDDDTWYDDGDIGGGDRAMYDSLLAGEPMDVRFLQTNRHLDFGWQYQHNKYVIMDGESVFCGTGHFTSSAFRDNYETFYLIRQPELASRFTSHFERLHSLGRAPETLPLESDY